MLYNGGCEPFCSLVPNLHVSYIPVKNMPAILVASLFAGRHNEMPSVHIFCTVGFHVAVWEVGTHFVCETTS